MSLFNQGSKTKMKYIPVSPLTLSSSDERDKYGDKSNTDGNTKEILVLGKQYHEADALSHRQQVCYFK